MPHNRHQSAGLLQGPLVQPLQNDRKHSKANHLRSVYSGAKFTVFRHMCYILYCSNPVIYVQADLVLLCLVFIELWRLLGFLQMEGLWQSWVRQFYWHHFQQHLLAACLCHILIVLTLFQMFSQLLYLLWWSGISDVRHFLAIKYF